MLDDDDEPRPQRPNLSLPQPPPDPDAVYHPDGRRVPDSWASLLFPVARRLTAKEGSRIAETCRRLHAGPDPAELLALPLDRWRYAQIGGDVVANRLAKWCTDAGWPPGCLAVPEMPGTPRRLTLAEATATLSPDDQRRWLALDCPVDEHGRPVLSPDLKVVGGGSVA